MCARQQGGKGRRGQGRPAWDHGREGLQGDIGPQVGPGDDGLPGMPGRVGEPVSDQYTG